MKTATCKVSFQGFSWRNILTVISPTGTTIALHCNGRWKKFSPELEKLTDELQYGKIKWGTTVKRNLSYDVMNEIKGFINN